MPANLGKCPDDAKGKRVHVQLFNGYTTTTAPRSDMEPPGWPADGPRGCSWDLSDPPHPFQIKRWKII